MYELHLTCSVFFSQLNQNVRTVHQNLNRIQVTLKDRNVITLDKLTPNLVQRTKEYIEKLRQGKTGNYTLFVVILLLAFTSCDFFWSLFQIEMWLI